jgi:hypothetical protein
MPLKPEDLPSTPRPEYVAVAPDIRLIRDLLGGTRVMHREYRTYIPKYRSEPSDRYKIRATSAIVYGGLGRSLSASVGMLFAKPPQQQDTWPADVEEQWENIDGKGTHGDVFAKRRSRDALADGYVGILVDFPEKPADVVVTKANEEALNLRPLWAAYTRADILSWRTEIVHNVETLTQVVLREGAAVDVGRFSVAPRVLYRVCRLTPMRVPRAGGMHDLVYLATWELLEEVKVDGGAMKVVTISQGVFTDVHGDPFDEIPLAVCYTGDTNAMFASDPPLLDLAWANLEYWQIASELRWYQKLAAHPQAVLEGELAGDGGISADGQVIRPQVKLGPTTLIQLAAGGKFSWMEVSGRSFAALQEALAAKKDEMADLGASFLRKLARGVETAEAKRLDATAENATLATAAQGIEDGFNEALRFHAKYLGIDAENAPTLKINRDFEGLLMDAPTMVAYVSLVNAGYPKALVLEALQVGGRIADDADLEQLEAEWEAGLQAEQDAAAMAAQDQATMNAAPGGTAPTAADAPTA